MSNNLVAALLLTAMVSTIVWLPLALAAIIQGQAEEWQAWAMLFAAATTAVSMFAATTIATKDDK